MYSKIAITEGIFDNLVKITRSHLTDSPSCTIWAFFCMASLACSDSTFFVNGAHVFSLLFPPSLLLSFLSFSLSLSLSCVCCVYVCERVTHVGFAVILLRVAATHISQLQQLKVTKLISDALATFQNESHVVYYGAMLAAVMACNNDAGTCAEEG